MEMFFELECPHCGHALRIPVKYLGQRGQCVKCRGAVDTSVNMRLKGGGTLLHNAVQKGDPNLVEFLLTRGADPNAKDDTGITPLETAKVFQQDTIGSLLIKNGAIQPPSLPVIPPVPNEEVEEQSADALESTDDAYAQIERLARLKEMGAITEQEFVATKMRLLSGLGRREQGAPSGNGNRPASVAEARRSPPPIETRRESTVAGVSAGHQQAAIMIQAKSTGLAVVLALLFGGVGLLYASIFGGIIMSLVEVCLWLIALVTLGFGIILLFPFHAMCVIWAIIAVGSHNKRLLAQSRQ